MNQDVYSNILKAIKLNDLALFSSSIKGNENLSFGRFPILSLCYLYNAKKIIKTFEQKLSKIMYYKKITENFEIYQQFRKVAGKCLRLYVGEEKTVSPLEMLAILGKERKVKNYYNFYNKNIEIITNIKEIYKIKGQSVEINPKSIKTHKKTLSYHQKRLVKLAFIFPLSFILILSAGFTILNFTTGLGTEWSNFKISSQNQFLMALNSSGHYTVDNDVILDEIVGKNSFSGVIDGKNHTIYINSIPSRNLIENNFGIIKNLNIVYAEIDAEISKSLSLLVGTNSGTIENVNISCQSLKLVTNKTQEHDIFVNSFANTNTGTVQNCNLDLKMEVVGEENGECYVSGFVGKNVGTINNCVLKENSSILTSEADVSGIASFNEIGAKVSNSKNFAQISQNSNLNQ